MSKSIYSLVLTDEVIDAVDALACKQGTSRSNTIDNILAEYLGFDTPERRCREILSGVQKLVSDSVLLRFSDMSSYNMATILSVLPYRYNPTIRYVVELFEDEGAIGQLKVTLRTSNNALVQSMQQFFETFGKLESEMLPYPVRYSATDGRYVRILNRPHNAKQPLSAMITRYVEVMQQMLRLYFNSTDSQSTSEQLVDMYSQYVTTGDTL